jgi:hypothetical protein
LKSSNKDKRASRCPHIFLKKDNKMGVFSKQVYKEIFKKEQELLKEGFSIKETAKMLNISENGLWRRNKNTYKIDAVEVLKKKFEKEGIPSRLSVSDDFGYWFSGFFDGEGHFMMDMHKRLYLHEKYVTKLGIRVKLRKDDEKVIDYIIENFKIGKKYDVKRYKTTNESCCFCIGDIMNLAEVIVPFFEKYTLKSKKLQEFSYWKDLVFDKYIHSNKGTRNYEYSEEYIKKFIDYREIMTKIRKPDCFKR